MVPKSLNGASLDIRIPLYSCKIRDFGSKTQVSGGSERTFDSLRPVVAEIPNELNCQSGSENGSVATWLWFNFLGPIARYHLGAQAQALETRFQSPPAHSFWHDCQITQLVVVASQLRRAAVTPISRTGKADCMLS